VIDHGRIVWDGALNELVAKLHPEKRVTLRLLQPRPRHELELPSARLISMSENEARYSVPKEALPKVVAGLLGRLPVADLTVEDAPLEEVLAQLFSQAAP
jgi:ABC-2 type transport system ATP-binding protein